MQSSKDCLVPEFYYFPTPEKYRIVFHFMMEIYIFNNLVSNMQQRSSKDFVLDTDCQNDGCGLYMMAYT